MAPRSLVLVTVDCLRADHVGFLGYTKATTPFLDSLAALSTVFSNAFVAGAPTYFSFPAIMASRYPLALGRDIIGLAPSEPTLASVLRDAGYATAAFVAGNPYLTRSFGYHAGFDVFRDFLDQETTFAADSSQNGGLRTRWNHKLADVSHQLGPLGHVYDELYFRYCQSKAPASSLDALRRFPAADVIVDHAAAWLAENGSRPFFLWLHLMDPHSPYYPPALALELMGNSCSAERARYLNSYWNRGELGVNSLRQRREQVVALYDTAIRWVDTQVCRLMQTLNKAGAWDSCVLTLTADHGEEFLEHGGRYHAPCKLSEELIHVPLLVRVSGQNAGVRNPEPTSLLHLAPTLLEIVGQRVPKAFRGRSCWRQSRGTDACEAVISECVAGCTNPLRHQDRLGARILAIRESRYKLVLDFSCGSEQLFDLEADPGELSPLPPNAEKTVRRRLLRQARAHVADSLKLRDVHSRLASVVRDLRLKLADSPEKISVSA